MIPLLLDCLAAYRLTRLITADSILDGPRDALVKLAYGDKAEEVAYVHGGLTEPGAWAAFAMVDPKAPKLATLVTCRWCSSVWLSFGIVIARRFFPRAWPPIAEALALSAGAALIAGLED